MTFLRTQLVWTLHYVMSVPLVHTPVYWRMCLMSETVYDLFCRSCLSFLLSVIFHKNQWGLDDFHRKLSNLSCTSLRCYGSVMHNSGRLLNQFNDSRQWSNQNWLKQQMGMCIRCRVQSSSKDALKGVMSVYWTDADFTMLSLWPSWW